MSLHLMSHTLCPYVQRAVISLYEKKIPFKRTNIDLANKPDWFLEISPLGKTPVLTDQDQPIFESAVILEYLEDTQSNPLHPQNPIERAQHRGWIEYGSSILNEIAGFYSARDSETFEKKRLSLKEKFERLEEELGEDTFFKGNNFSLVDATFGPIFRYFDVFDQVQDFGILSDKPKLQKWRQNLSNRASVKQAVADNYNDLLTVFLKKRDSYLSKQMNA
ncbi:glutathione S-transferase family protein [Curvivirga sp.]|uniref:glutathione S-transferase family protein n=1 Tax=Curvivirga sp. TaxID=2856848 RepID=UPI003B5A406F